MQHLCNAPTIFFIDTGKELNCIIPAEIKKYSNASTWSLFAANEVRVH